MARRALRCITRRRLAFEPLEQRELLATITVTSLADNLAVDGQVTLREAVRAAELNVSVDGSVAGSGGDTIQFAAGLSGAVNLSIVGDTAQGATALGITSDLIIRGNANGITIQRAGTAAEMRLFRVASGGRLSFESITVAGGLFRGANGVGPNGSGGEGRGGAIFNQGTLTVSASTLVGNEVHGGNGVGTGAGGSARGGAIYNDGGSVSIINATLSGNGAFAGDGVGVVSSFGGGVFGRNGSLSIYNSTITDGTATTGRGAYLLAVGGTATATIHSSIIAQADASLVSLEFIATDDTGGTLMVTGENNLIRTQNNFNAITISSANPLLGPLASNSGPTGTHSLLASSPAIDQGANPLNLLNDQRGGIYARVMAGRADIGAFEVQTTTGPALPGDYNRNSVVDAADFVLWRKTMGSNVATFAGADGNGNGMIDPADYAVWRANFGRTTDVVSATAAAPAVRVRSTAVADVPSFVVANPFVMEREDALGELPALPMPAEENLLLAQLDALSVRQHVPSSIAPTSADEASSATEQIGTLDALWSVWPETLESLIQ